MKKIIKITAAIVILLLLFFVGTFKYRQYKANQVFLPANAVSLLKISADEIYKSIAINMLAHPGYYLQSDLKQKRKSTFNVLDHGLKIPAGIYLYSIQNQPKTALFSRMEIDDLLTFENFLTKILQFNIEKSAGGLNYAQSKLGNVLICYNNHNAAIAVSNEIADFKSVLIDILKQKNFIELKKSRFQAIRKSTQHLVFASNDHMASVNFNAGEIEFNDEFSANTIIPAPKPFHRSFNPKSAISFWLNADFAAFPDRALKLKNIHLDQDSLNRYYKGYIDFEWLDTMQQTDSIITYAYNDDFEKVEQVKLQKKTVPNFIINIQADASKLKNYLVHQNVIDPDSAIIYKSVFPLYRVFVSDAEKNLILSTKKPQQPHPTQVSTNDFFALNVDFVKLKQQLNQPIFTRYFKNLSHLGITGRKTTNGKIKVDGKLKLVDKDINALFQLLKGS